MKNLASCNIYEVNIRQYTKEGTFLAFIEHLPRLKEMGVQVLWLMPIYPIGKKNRKGKLGSYYAIANFEDVNEEFGTKNDFKLLIETAHSFGIKIILDWVANHASWDNVWINQHPDYFDRTEHGDFFSPFDWDDVIQINHNSINQQLAMINAMKYWISEFDIDGFRADMAHLTPLQFWINARKHTAQIKPNLIWLAETENTEYAQAFDITYTWEWMHISEKICKQLVTLNEAIQVLIHYITSFPSNHHRLYFTSNHDENSWTATEYEKYGIYVKAMSVFSFLYKSIPLIYSGQELPNLKQLAFFEKDEIEWGSQILLHDFYKKLIDIRNNNYLLFENATVVFNEMGIENNILCYQIYNEDISIIVCLNFSTTYSNFTIPNVVGYFKDSFTCREMYLHHSYYFNEPPGSYLVLEQIKNR